MSDSVDPCRCNGLAGARPRSNDRLTCYPYGNSGLAFPDASSASYSSPDGSDDSPYHTCRPSCWTPAQAAAARDYNRPSRVRTYSGHRLSRGQATDLCRRVCRRNPIYPEPKANGRRTRENGRIRREAAEEWAADCWLVCHRRWATEASAVGCPSNRQILSHRTRQARTDDRAQCCPTFRRLSEKWNKEIRKMKVTTLRVRQLIINSESEVRWLSQKWAE